MELAGPGILWKSVRGNLAASVCPGGFGNYSAEYPVDVEESENSEIVAVALAADFSGAHGSAAFAKVEVKAGLLLSCLHC